MSVGRWWAFLGGVALLQSLMAAPAAGVEPARDPTAAPDEELVDQLAAWDKVAFFVPNDQPLDEPLRRFATDLARQQAATGRAVWQRWLTEERRESPRSNLQSGRLLQSMFSRALNEFAIWSIESDGPEQDAAWLAAAQAPTACQSIPTTFFARRMAMIQAAPARARPVLMQAEQAALARWGTNRRQFPPRPPAAELEAADQAISLLRGGSPVTAEPMSPNLADQIFNRDRKPGPPDRWERCAKSQWWLAAQLASGKTDRMAALALYRYSTMQDVAEYLPNDFRQRFALSAAAVGKPDYPPAAVYFEVQGSLVVEADADAAGQLLRSRIVSRQLTVSGVRDVPPVAFETLLDDAAKALAAKRTYPQGQATTGRFQADWVLE